MLVPAEIEPVHILHRSERLLVVDKPSGRLVHRTALSRGPREPFLLQSVAAAVGRPVHAVHRLDRGTSGVLLMAMDPEAARLAQQALAAPGTRKDYLVLVRGEAADRFESDRPLRGEDGTPRPCRTEFQCLGRRPDVRPDGVSLLLASLATGRRHQIRRHLNHLGHHVVGDTTHGKGHVNRSLRAEHGCHRLFLHARRLGFDDPFGGPRWRVESPVPPDLQRVLESIGLAEAAGDPAIPVA
jgi:tRNA pseudouridine65 synthase